MPANVEVEVKRDLYDLGQDLGLRRNGKTDRGIDYPHSIKAEAYAREDDPLHAFNEAYSNSNIMLTPDPEGGSLSDFQEMLDYTWGSDESGTHLEALAINQHEHLPVLNEAKEVLEQNGYQAKTVIEFDFTEDCIKEAVKAVEENGARVSLALYDGPQGKEVIREGQRTNIQYNAGNQSLTPEVTADKNSLETSREIEEDLENILEEQGLLR